jgi:hypothetical protein
MKSLWNFLAKPQNLTLLIALGAGLAFVWKEVARPVVLHEQAKTADAPEKMHPQPAINQNATASDGGAAIISTGNGSNTIQQK